MANKRHLTGYELRVNGRLIATFYHNERSQVYTMAAELRKAASDITVQVVTIFKHL